MQVPGASSNGTHQVPGYQVPGTGCGPWQQVPVPAGTILYSTGRILVPNGVLLMQPLPFIRL